MTDMRDLANDRAELLHQCTRQQSYDNNERPSRLLALRLRKSEHFTSIISIKNENSNTYTVPSQINDVFFNHHKQLYKSHRNIELMVS